MKREEEKKAVQEFLNAIANYGGNSLTNYQPFQTLMIEEKINIIADILVILLTDKIEKLDKDIKQ